MIFTTSSINQDELLAPLDELVQACIKGNRLSQNILYKKYASKMFGVCLRYAKNREEAEEIMQEGFMRVFTYIKQFKGTGALEGWIRKIMVNCALLRYQKKIHMKPVIELNTELCNAAGDTDIISNLNAKELLKLIQSLSPAYRMVFNLYVFEGLKHREIAQMLGISEGTSKSNLSDARAVLQKALQTKNNITGFKTNSL